MLTQLLNESAPSGEQAQGAVAFSRLGDGKPHNKTAAGTATSASLVLIGALLTGFGLYCKIASYAGAGTLVPITGFSNSIAAPALEFKTEGLVLGTCAKMFTIAGPVIVCGVAASAVYGIIYCLCTLL